MEKSAYIKDKLAHGQTITRRYCQDQRRAVAYWAAYFGEDKALGTLTRQELRDFDGALKAEGRAAQTVNNITVAGCIALSWAAAEGIIPANPSEGLRRFKGSVETGDLTRREILAVRKNDIGAEILNVNHSWSNVDGLKSTKNGESRRVGILPEVRANCWRCLGKTRTKGIPLCFIRKIPPAP